MCGARGVKTLECKISTHRPLQFPGLVSSLVHLQRLNLDLNVRDAPLQVYGWNLYSLPSSLTALRLDMLELDSPLFVPLQTTPTHLYHLKELDLRSRSRKRSYGSSSAPLIMRNWFPALEILRLSIASQMLLELEGLPDSLTMLVFDASHGSLVSASQTGCARWPSSLTSFKIDSFVQLDWTPPPTLTSLYLECKLGPAYTTTQPSWMPPHLTTLGLFLEKEHEILEILPKIPPSVKTLSLFSRLSVTMKTVHALPPTLTDVYIPHLMNSDTLEMAQTLPRGLTALDTIFDARFPGPCLPHLPTTLTQFIVKIGMDDHTSLVHLSRFTRLRALDMEFEGKFPAAPETFLPPSLSRLSVFCRGLIDTSAFLNLPMLLQEFAIKSPIHASDGNLFCKLPDRLTALYISEITGPIALDSRDLPIHLTSLILPKFTAGPEFLAGLPKKIRTLTLSLNDLHLTAPIPCPFMTDLALILNEFPVPLSHNFEYLPPRVSSLSITAALSAMNVDSDIDLASLDKLPAGLVTLSLPKASELDAILRKGGILLPKLPHLQHVFVHHSLHLINSNAASSDDTPGY